MNPINAILFVSILFGASIANAQNLASLSESYSLTATGVSATNISGTIITLIFTQLSIHVDEPRGLEYFTGEYNYNGLIGTYSYIISENELAMFTENNGTCTQTELPQGFAFQRWNALTVDARNANYFTNSVLGVTVTIGSDGYPTRIYYTGVDPAPFTFNITIISFSNMGSSFSTFRLPQECTTAGIVCNACYSSGMMVTGSVLFLMCAVVLQVLFHAL